VVITLIDVVANAGPDGSDCKAENLSLQATGQGTWTVISGNVSLSSNTSPNPVINNIAEGENILIWTVEEGGCSVSDTVVLELLPVSECVDSIKIPTGFSPNGDGVNDNFQILGIELYPNNELTIFNRWGNVVYFKQNYLNEWNGSNSNGEPLPDATYFVIFTSEDKKYQYSGYVDLRRQ
jgi:gliding motility-associated-like protein